MKKSVAVLISLIVATVAVAGPVRKLTLEEQAFSAACAISKYSCRGLTPPDIIFVPLDGLRGRYVMGETFVAVDERMSPAITFAVIVHEYTHFLQWKAGAWTGSPESTCANEREAFAVANVVLEALGADLVDWEGSMRLAYGCPPTAIP